MCVCACGFWFFSSCSWRIYVDVDGLLVLLLSPFLELSSIIHIRWVELLSTNMAHEIIHTQGTLKRWHRESEALDLQMVRRESGESSENTYVKNADDTASFLGFFSGWKFFFKCVCLCLCVSVWVCVWNFSNILRSTTLFPVLSYLVSFFCCRQQPYAAFNFSFDTILLCIWNFSFSLAGRESYNLSYWWQYLWPTHAPGETTYARFGICWLGDSSQLSDLDGVCISAVLVVVWYAPLMLAARQRRQSVYNIHTTTITNNGIWAGICSSCQANRSIEGYMIVNINQMAYNSRSSSSICAQRAIIEQKCEHLDRANERMFRFAGRQLKLEINQSKWPKL